MDLLPVIEDIRAARITTTNGIVAALYERSIPTARGGTWQVVQVQRVLARAGA